MSKNHLNIISISSERSNDRLRPASRYKEMQAKFERLWLIDPEQFNPLRNCLEKERLERTWILLKTYSDLKNKSIVDLGCGSGVFSRRMQEAGSNVMAIDIADNALKYFKAYSSEKIQTKQAAVPETNLPDESYDIVCAMELIAELPSEDYRLFFAELARLIKPDGNLVCSTSIDIETDGAIERLLSLAQTEFDIYEVKKSYHALHIRLKSFFQAPSLFVQASQSQEMRQNELAKRAGFGRYWFSINSSWMFAWIWKILNPLTQPFLSLLRNNRSVSLSLESICEFISNDKGVSHLIFMAKRRPIHMETEPEEIPLERMKKREVWE